jgi:hypothetical protein
MKKNTTVTISYNVWLASIFGAVFAAFGFGVLVGQYIPTLLAILFTAAGVLLHGWGMYTMYKK